MPILYLLLLAVAALIWSVRLAASVVFLLLGLAAVMWLTGWLMFDLNLSLDHAPNGAWVLSRPL